MPPVDRGERASKKRVHNEEKPKRHPPKKDEPSVAAIVRSNLAADIRKRLQLNRGVFARLPPVSVRSLATVESGAEPSEVVARRLCELRRLTDALTEVIRQESLGKWLQTPNEAFDGLKPLEVIERGESHRIWSMIYFLRSGTPS